MLVAEGADSTRSLPATKDVSPNSSLNARPDDPDGFSAAWVNPTDVKISWDLPSGMLVSDIEYKLYRGAATFKNEQTGVIGNMTGYDYTTETAITVSLDNYTGAKLAVVDKPSSPTAPDGKVWVYRLVAVRYGYDSESVFAAIGLENAPSLSSANFSVAGHALDATQAFITWDVDEDLYDATFTLTRARILSPTADTEGTGSSGVLQLSDIESVGSYASVTIAQTDYLEGKAVVIDKASDLTTRSRWLYRLVAKKGNLASEPTYAILQDSAFVAATSVTLTDANTSSALNAAGSADPNLYQAANTQRIALGNLSGTYWGDNPAITLYRREASQPETAYEIVLNGTDPAFPVGNVQTAAGTPADSVVFTDPGLDYNKQYIYKVVVTNTGGTIRFKNSGGVSSSLTPTKTTVTLSAYSGGMSLSSNAIRLSAVGSSGGNAYLQGMKVKVRTKVHGTSQYTAAWQVLTVARGNESGSGTAADPNVYSYYVNITGLTGGIAYDIQYWSDGTSEPSGSANTINNLTAN
jgi:hypothetical protein